jgi:hypothetical protein
MNLIPVLIETLCNVMNHSHQGIENSHYFFDKILRQFKVAQDPILHGYAS